MIQVNLDEEEDKIVSIYKIENKLETKEQAVKGIVKNCKKCYHKFEMVGVQEGMIKRVVQRCINCGIIRMDKLFSSGTIETTFSKK